MTAVLECNALSFSQVLQSGPLDCGDMNEHITDIAKPLPPYCRLAMKADDLFFAEPNRNAF